MHIFLFGFVLLKVIFLFQSFFFIQGKQKKILLAYRREKKIFPGFVLTIAPTNLDDFIFLEMRHRYYYFEKLKLLNCVVVTNQQKKILDLLLRGALKYIFL
jgi:hypothetical protein